METKIDEYVQSCIDCKRCMQGCPMLHAFTVSPKTLLTHFSTEKPTSDMAFSCANCGLCAHLCPNDIDFGHLFADAKRTYAKEKSILKKYGYDGVRFHQKHSFSKRFSAKMKFSKGEYTHMAFMPGCALSSYSPSLVQTVFLYLRSILPGIGIIQQCCGTPTRVVGDMQQFGVYHSRLENDLASMGASMVVSACENCYMSLKTYAPHVEVVSLYSVLAKHGIPKEAMNAYAKHEKVALHDPCPTRFERHLHEDVRTLLGWIGLPFEEFKHNREKTLCCGSGGMLELTNPPLARQQMKTRAEQTACKSIVSYCQSCAESMSKGGKNGLHLLDFIFSTNAKSTQPRLNVVKKWYNRYRSRKQIEALKDVL